MPMTVLVHMMNEDPIVAEVDRLPDPTDQFLVCENPRRRDGRDLSYVLPEVRALIVPWHRVHCVEILPSEEEEKIVTFVRE
ncbi:MAG TPA: hypothetical protein EYH30_01880 [Anaerolineales bacterium]|nr:hypothetical protein [Anaerolineae bacterium]HIQ00875.1 hypothetical protein [Anaerolineales bacterium]